MRFLPWLILTIFSSVSLLASQALENRLESLEDQIQKLQKEHTALQDDYADMNDILELVERKSILDSMNLNAELQLRLDSFAYDSRYIEGENTPDYKADPHGGIQRRDEFTKNFDPASMVRFRFNLSAHLLEDLSFHGRLVMVRSSQSYQRLCILSQDIKSADAVTAFDVDRAYFDYKFNKDSRYPMVLSAGVLPTTGGTPVQYGEFNVRQSLYPALVFDMDSYGLIVTTNISNLLNQESFIRAIMARAYTLNPNIYPYQCNRENIDNAEIYGLFVDTRFSEKSLFSMGLNYLNNVKAHPYLGPNISTEDAHVLGSMMTLGMGLDIESIGQTPLSVFLHTALSMPDGNGKKDDYQIDPNTYVDGVGFTQDNKVGYSEADYAQGTMLEDQGYSIYAGLQYAFTPEWHLGAEYNYGSQYWFAATQGAEDMYNKLAIRGHVGETYLAWNFHENMFLKAAYMYTKEEYTGSGWHFGEPAKKDAVQEVSYLLVNAKF
ncbi:MAG: DUF3373 family protein [Campylobacterota bacterium]|nr:DUF3373 family protein [Campylobacterota bacterium]